MSPRHFARVFKRQIGATPASFVERLRIDAAKRLLETSDCPIKEVAQSCGFGDPSTLRRIFSRRSGMTADEYRRRFSHRARA